MAKRLKSLFILWALLSSPVYGAVSAGMMVGDPTGLSIKSWQGNHALDFGLGWNSGFAYVTDRYGRVWGVSSRYIAVTADYVTHQYGLFRLNEGKLPIYYGVGAAVVAGSYGALGVRVPLGLDFIFSHHPIDIFAEVAPTMMLVPGTHFDVGAAVGVRYKFH